LYHGLTEIGNALDCFDISKDKQITEIAELPEVLPWRRIIIQDQN
jgi:hypothetical protein